MSISKCLLMAVLLLVVATWRPVAAQVRRCTTPEGRDIFTDRQCPEVGAVEQPPRAAETAGSVEQRGGGCVRSLRDLVQELNGAFDTRDANRLAGLYHWNGMSSTAAYTVLERLDALVQRPLVGIYPVMPIARNDTVPAEASISEDVTTPPAPPQPRQAPVALRVEQTLANGRTPSHTVFGLQKYFGCWWIKD